MAYVCSNKLNRLKHAKTPFLSENHCDVVYKIHCQNASYVGQIRKQLFTRIKEHRSNINRTALSYSVITDLHYWLHQLSGHEFDWSNICILNEGHSYVKRCISEMLHIKQQKNGNLQEDTNLLDSSYFPILQKCSH